VVLAIAVSAADGEFETFLTGAMPVVESVVFTP
jgi:hypothetical protein